MALRMIEMVLPESPEFSVEDALQGFGVLGSWQVLLEGDKILIRVLVDSVGTESVMDHLSEYVSLGQEERLWITDITATLPEPEREKKEEPEATASQKEGAPQQKERVAVIEIVQNLVESGKLTRTFLLTTFLASVIACVGLVKDSTAVIVGAMVIAPLLAPTMGISLGTTLGDSQLIRAGSRNTILGGLFTLSLGVVIGLAFEFDLTSDALLSRTRVDLLDMAVALAAGSAGSLAYTTGISGAVVGVMVAVALLPPLVAAGLFLGQGGYANAALSFLLYIVNITCVILAGVLTFWFQGVRPARHWEAERARAMVLRAIGFASVSVVLLVLAILILDGTIPVPFLLDRAS